MIWVEAIAGIAAMLSALLWARASQKVTLPDSAYELVTVLKSQSLIVAWAARLMALAAFSQALVIAARLFAH